MSESSIPTRLFPTPQNANGSETSTVPPPRISPVDVPATGQEARYRVLRPLGKGGLGEVHVALDGELNREVALKEVQAQHLDNPDSVARFLREAEVTGRLEHPGIVPVYGLGIHSDGRPYYAMRLIRGESFQGAIDRFHQDTRSDPGERAIAFRDLLQRFVAVCNTLGYAHARGVIHRDLKPANVMLGPYGETLVIDWGLAKIVHASAADGVAPRRAPPLPHVEPSLRAGATLPPASATQAGVVFGTPGFMSPEQATGQVETIGPVSDVYSLGAMLYALLTGHPPRPGAEKRGLVVAEDAGRNTTPSTENRAVAPALEAICLKAMAPQPERRYATARALAADVERWLADEPVSVYHEPRMVRLGRWARRRRTLVTGLGVLLATIVAALGVGMILLREEKNQTEQAASQARQQAEVARKQTALARTSMRKGLEAIDSSLNRLSEEVLANVPGTQSLRKDLLEQASAGYQDLLSIWGDEPEVQAEVGRAWIRLALISSHTGSESHSLKLIDNALDYQRNLLRTDPDNVRYQLDLATTLFWKGGKLSRMKALEEADRVLQESLKISMRLSQELELPRDQVFWLNSLRLVVQSGTVRAEILSMRGKLEDAGKLYDALIGLLTEADGRLAGNSNLHQSLAYVYIEAGLFHNFKGEGETAVKELDKARKLLEGLPEQERVRPVVRQWLGNTYNALFLAQFRNKQHEAAGACLLKALAIREEQVRGNPLVAPYRAELASSVSNLAYLRSTEGKKAEAVSLYERAAQLYEEVLVVNKDVVEYQHSRARMYLLMAERQQELGDLADARSSIEKFTNTQSKEPELWYRAGLCLAGCAKGVAADPKVPEPRREEERLRFAAQAVQALLQARKFGFADRDRLNKELPLAALQGADGLSEMLKHYGMPYPK